MRLLVCLLMLVALIGCATSPPQPCKGDIRLPETLAADFEAIDDPALLAQSLGSPDAGSLCQGQVYRAKTGTAVRVHRAWNSTSAKSERGHWWVFERPAGSISDYRDDFAICYEFSPLDRLVSCTVKPGATLVVGTGQSIKCSEYLTYPVSAAQQVYIADATSALADCSVQQGYFDWR